MPAFDIRVKHNEETLMALSHMQYDLFCTRNRIARSALSAVLIVVGVIYGSNWWSLLIVGYGVYLMTSTYAAANHTARKLAEQLKAAKLPFPSSRYVFEADRMRIYTLPDGEEMEPLRYSAVLRLGEDRDAYYLFRDQYGGYRVPKKALGEREEEFCRFVQTKTGKPFYRRRPTPLQRLREWLRRREQEPEHL